MRSALGFALALVLWGCASYYHQALDIRAGVARGEPLQALQALEHLPAKQRDKTLYHLNKGLLLHLNGDYADSNAAFEIAKAEAQRLEAISIAENIGALSINETLRSYPVQPHEKLLLHAYMTMNYLLLGNYDEARVEILQADSRMREWEAGGELESLLAAAFVRYLSGVVFETMREWDNALIAYRKAYQIYFERREEIPYLLRADLLRLTDHLGLLDEHQQYRAEFTGVEWPTQQEAQQYGELVYIAGKDMIAALREHAIQAYSMEAKAYFRIAVPYYLPAAGHHPILRHALSVGGQAYSAELVADLDQLAYENLQSRLPGITARSLARLVVKRQVAKKADDEHPIYGVLANVAGLITETADTRSWSILPAAVYVARVLIKPGEQRILLTLRGDTETVQLHAGEKKFLVDHQAFAQPTPIGRKR